MLFQFKLGRRVMMIVAICALVSVIASTGSAAPTIGNITPRGLQVGGTTTVVIDGSDLPAQPQLVLPVPIAKQTVKPGGTATHAEIEVQLPDSIATGIEHLRLAGAGGISNSVLVGLDRLRQAPFAAEAG